MASFIQQPSTISFANNPIIVSVKPSLTGYSFHRIVLEVTTQGMGSPSTSHLFKLSLSANGTEELVFDVSMCIQAMMENYTINRTNGIGTVSTFAPYVKYSYKAYEQYTDEYGALINYGTVESTASRYALPGGYTAKERLSKSADIASQIQPFALLSSKPSVETVPASARITIPFVSTIGQTVSFNDSEKVLAEPTAVAYRPEWVEVTLSDGETQIAVSPETAGDGVEKVFRVSTNPMATRFEFVNHLGVVESIYVFGREEVVHNLESERLELRPKESFKPSARFLKRNINKEEQIVLSTGPLSKEWAEWFVRDFFTATQVWMYDAELNDMVPVIITVDSSITTFSQQNPQLTDIPFTVTICIS